MKNFNFVLSTLFNQHNSNMNMLISGKRIVLTLSCLIVFMLTFTPDLNAQAYTVIWSGEDAGNPGGLNTESDFNVSGWTEIIPASQSSNYWSTAHSIPFSFQFFGSSVTEIKVSLNGLITFDVSASGTPPNDNTNLPDASLPDNTIAGFWDNFTNSPPTGSNDMVATKTFGTAPNRQFWIKYRSLEYASYEWSIFAVVLEETSNKVYMVDMAWPQYGSGSSTVGVQQNSTTAVEYSGSPNVSFNSGNSAFSNNEYYTLAPVESCPAPSGQTVSNVTTSGADLGWTETGTAAFWDLYIIETGGVPPTSITTPTVDDTQNNPYTWDGGIINTTYDWYVRADCGQNNTDVSSWTGASTFSTCYSTPFFEPFTNTTLPANWTNTGPENWLFSTGAEYGAAAAGDHTPGGGTQYAWIDGTDDIQSNELKTPYIDLSGITTPAFKFYYFSNNVNQSGNNTLTVGFWDGAAWNTLLTYSGNNPDWQKAYFNLSEYTITGSIQFRFVVTETMTNPYFNDILIDDVEVYSILPDIIPPTVSVDVPNGGEEWMFGETYQIQWTSDDNQEIFCDSVFYSVDNGSNWTFIESFTSNQQAYDWEIPNNPCEQCLIKVLTYDVMNNSATDISDQVFTILPDNIPPTVTVDVPNGGEVWTAWVTYQIQWTAGDNQGVSSDSLFYSVDNGSNWIFIESQTGNPQAYDWEVPNNPSEQCLVKVIVFDDENNSTEDVSNAVFTIEEGVQPPPQLYQTEYNTGTSRPRGLCTADMDQDGNIDVIVMASPPETGMTIKVWLNNGTGMLTESTFPSQTSHLLADANLVTNDFNNDGFPDIVQGTNGSSGVQNGFVVFMNDGTGALLPGTVYNSANENGIGKVAVADFDKDGFVDIVASDHLVGITVYFNNGAGVFVDTDVYNSTFLYNEEGSVFNADFNNDGWEDIILNGDKIFINNGTGVFDSDVSIGGDYYNVCVGDFDADGNVDVVAKSTIYWGDGAMGFTTQELTVPVANINGWSDAGDINGDGLIDIVQGVGGSFTRLVFYFNQGNHNFSEPEMYEISSATSFFSQVECADLNNDGAAEALIAGDGSFSFECFSSTPFVEHDVSALFADMPLIPSPAEIYEGGDLVPVVPFRNEMTPRLEIKNMGQHTETFNNIFQVLEEGSIIYEEILSETLTAGESKVIDFSPWEPVGDVGTQYEIKLFTDLAGDEFPENDIVTDIFTVDTVSIHSYSLPIQNAYGQAIVGNYFAKAMRLTPLAYPAQITDFKCLLSTAESVQVTFCVWSDVDPDYRDTFEPDSIIWSTTVNIGPYSGWYVVNIPDSVIIQSQDVEYYVGGGWPILSSGADIFQLWKGDVVYARNRYGNSSGTGINDLTWTDSGYWPHICGTVKYFESTGDSISVNLNAFLEGPFNQTDMNTGLNPDHIPLSQPYNIAPWDYTGTESFVSIPNANVVDWVLVELRDTTEAQ
ncbi:MAG: VCBS repeat-containing protein, partial [Bacteroidales bacterium]|nr:VCBS repeat-containing protein [Bacteroidales bacterium]